MMEEQMVSLGFIALGLLFIMVEAFTPGAYALIPGIVFPIIGVYGYMMPDDLYSPVTIAAAVAIAIPVTLFTILLYRKLGSPEPPTTTVAESLVGKGGVVTVAVEVGNMKGKVRIGTDTWSAMADEEIPVGTDVVVTESAGVHVKVVRKRSETDIPEHFHKLRDVFSNPVSHSAAYHRVVAVQLRDAEVGLVSETGFVLGIGISKFHTCAFIRYSPVQNDDQGVAGIDQ